MKVTAKSVQIGVERMTASNEVGYFQIPFLPLGTYEIRAEIRGFATVIAKDVAVTLNKTTTATLTLKVSAVEESVTVTDVAPLIDLASGQIRRSIDSTLAGSLPIGGRSFLGLTRLLPGFQTNPTSGQDNYTLSSGSSVSFNGTGTRSTTFLTDGVANDDIQENQHRQPVNISTIKEMQVLSTIKEMQVLTDNFAPEFGRAFGAVVLVQTKSGSNQAHGEAYWYLQNSALNARGFFANAAGSRVDPATGQTVPNVRKAVSQTHRAGGTLGGAVIKDRLFYFGSVERFWEPGMLSTTTYLLPPEWRAPRVDPQAPDAAARRAWVQSVIDRFPANLAPNNAPVSPYAYTVPLPRSSHTHDYSGRTDWRISNSDFLYARYQFSNFYFGRGEEVVKGENVKQDHRFQSLGLTHTHVFSPTATGEFRFGFGRRRMLVDFLNPADYPPIIRWSFTGFAPIIGNASAYPIRRFQNDFQYVYNFAIQLNDRAKNYNRGFWTFGSQAPYNAMENFLRGVVTTFQKGYGAAYVGLRMTEFNFYGQDEFRATQNLTFNLGFRFESVGAPGEVNNLYDAGYRTDNYFEPRFGFAYSPS